MNLQNQIEYLRINDLGDMFDGCAVPEPLDMQRVRGAIVMRCGLLTPLFSEPLLQRDATQQFFYENQWNFEHIIKIIQAEYSPIENVAEVREETTTNNSRDTLTINRTNTEKHSGTDGRTIQESGTTETQESGTTETQESGTTETQESGTTETQESGTTTKQASGDTTTTNEISAENATTYQADNKSTVSHGEGETLTHGRGETLTHGKGETLTHGRGETLTHGRGETLTHGKKTQDDFKHGEVITNGGSDQHTAAKDGTKTYAVNRHGNIGVTTNQDMINQELDLLERFNPYKFIANLYENELILGLY